MMRWLAMVFCFFGLLLCARSQEVRERPARPFADVDHVIVISIDGLRPDRLLLAQMPTMRGLLARGAYTFWARTTAVAVTLPSHVSMLTGVTPAKHGIAWNSDELPFSQTVYPGKPTLMEMARRAGYSTGMAAGKTKFGTLAKPGTVQFLHLPPKGGEGNAFAVTAAEEIIREHQPDLLFIHLPDVDAAGHAYGWDSMEQLAAIERTDGDLARIMGALTAAGLADRTAIIISADHGGAGRTHGPDDPRSRHIPWILVGPHVRQGDLTRLVSLEVNTEDTCATACYLLGLSQLPYFDGKPVLAAFENPPPP